MRAGRDVAWVFHHVGQQLAEQPGVLFVEFLVARPGVECASGVVLPIGRKYLAHQGLGEKRKTR